MAPAGPPPRSPSEVRGAIRELCESRADLQRLWKAAQRLMAGVRWAGLTQDHDDLFLEAIAKTLSGERSWPRDISRDQYFNMTMKGIRANWLKARLQEGPGIEQFEPGPERIAGAREELERIETLFSDQIERGILKCWGEGLMDRETQARLGISANQYHAARRRMERKLRQFRGEGR